MTSSPVKPKAQHRQPGRARFVTAIASVAALFILAAPGPAHDRKSDASIAPPEPARTESAPSAIHFHHPPADARLAAANHHHPCVPPALQQYVNQQCAINRRKLGLDALLPRPLDEGAAPAHAGIPGESGSASGGLATESLVPPILYTFFPMAGRTGIGDNVIGQFVDLDPNAPSLDFQCRTFGANDHAGHDCGLMHFGYQALGVPVYAAADGTVIFAQDGFSDMNLFGSFEQGNIVVIDHGPNIESQYFHLKNGSVAVTVGQAVKAGTQIGMAASSGNSFGPHLHFQTMVNGQVFEPFAGACRAGDSGWTDQAPLDSNTLYLQDFGITRTDLDAFPQPWWQPWELPTDSQFSTADQWVNFWWTAYNFPAGCPYRIRYLRPDNSALIDFSGNWASAEFFRVQKSWLKVNFQQAGTPPAGTWRIVFELNGQVMIDAPFVVVNGPADPAFNRPPEPIAALFTPAAPTASDVVRCAVSTTLAKEDLDWDVVRYRYEWKVNGNTVRDVTIGAQSDVLPHHVACGQSTLTCTVTPNDGAVNGTPAVASVVLAGPRGPDLTCDGVVNIDDFSIVVLTWNTAGAGDADGDNDVDIDDFTAVVLAWSQ